MRHGGTARLSLSSPLHPLSVPLQVLSYAFCLLAQPSRRRGRHRRHHGRLPGHARPQPSTVTAAAVSGMPLLERLNRSEASLAEVGILPRKVAALPRDEHPETSTKHMPRAIPGNL